MTWLETFLQKHSSAFFVRVDDDFLQDNFNFYGIKDRMTNFKEASNLLLNDQLSPKVTDPKAIKKKAAILYGHIHQRFLSTPEGLEKMYKKYRRSHFPKCPRVYCKNVSCLPYGVSDQPGEYKMMFYCPNCNDVYDLNLPEFENVDGAFFGPSYVHILFQKYPEIVPTQPQKRYVPNLFGFGLCKESDVQITNENQE